MKNNNLKKFREEKKMTGTELAKRVGVTHSMIYMIENGDRKPGVILAKKIADTLGKSIEEIFFDNECHETLPEHDTDPNPNKQTA